MRFVKGNVRESKCPSKKAYTGDRHVISMLLNGSPIPSYYTRSPLAAGLVVNPSSSSVDNQANYLCGHGV